MTIDSWLSIFTAALFALSIILLAVNTAFMIISVLHEKRRGGKNER